MNKSQRSLVVIALLLGGCGGKTEDPVSGREFLATIARTVCEEDAQCLRDWSDADAELDLGRSIERQHVAYDGLAARACVSRLARSDCATLDELNRRWPWQMPSLPECVHAVQPLVPLGGECFTPVECVPGGCSTDAGSPRATCIAPRAAGGSCHTSDDCADGLFCGAGNTCAAQKPPSQPCGDPRECLSGRCEGGQCQPVITSCP